MAKIHLIEDKTIGGVKREYIEVERVARAGDKIVIVNESYTGGTYGNGDILTVSDGYGSSVVCSEVANEENYNGQIDPEEFHVLDLTDIVHINGQRYQIAKREAEVGEKVVVVKADVAIGAYEDGDVFEVIEFQREVGDGAVYVNRKFHDGSQVFLNLPEYRVLTPVKPTLAELLAKCTPENRHEEVFAEPTPDIHDLLANLAQRVTSLERITGELVRAKSSLEKKLGSIESQLRDTQKNVQTFAELAETTKELTESNTKDIAFLDDRTFENPGKPAKSAEELLRIILKLIEENGGAGA